MNNQISQIKNENKKHLKKFILVGFICALFGATSGLMLKIFGGSLKDVPKYLNMILVYIIPYSICVIGGISFIICSVLYRKCEKIHSICHEENEELINKIENINGYSMIISSINLILTFFFFGAGVILEDSIFDFDNNIYKFLIFFLSYIINTIAIVRIQQKQVDFEKILNPEKRGSIYDTKFVEKWEESCDERERLVIYKSSYKAFKVTNIACIVIWVILILINTVWNVGVMPVFIVTIIWTVLTCSYSIEAMKLENNRGKK